MMEHSQQMDISQVRAVAARVLRGESTEPALVQAAQHTLQTMCREAAEHGLTTADIITAVFLPLFKKRRECGCPGCKARQDQLAQTEVRPDETPVA